MCNPSPLNPDAGIILAACGELPVWWPLIPFGLVCAYLAALKVWGDLA